MIPSRNKILTSDLTVGTMPSEQHRMQLQGDRIMGTCDGLDAIKQTIFKILNTERYAYIIYSWDYGIELADLFGQAPLFVCPEVERRIKEALLQDDRITAVDQFQFDTAKKGIVSVSFTVHTICGDVEESLEVNI